MVKKFKQYNIDDPIYHAQLTIFIGDVEEIRKYLKEKIDYDIGEVFDGKFIPQPRHKIIVMPKFEYDTLLHEVIHYVFAIFKIRGIPIKYQNDEVFAYYYEMTIKNILKSLHKKK